MEEEAKLPTVESMNEIIQTINSALKKFEEQNPSVNSAILMRIFVNLLMEYPWSWFSAAGHPENFLLAMMEDVVVYYKNHMPEYKAPNVNDL